MEIRHMRQLVAIRDLGSFAKAARYLNVSQPSLSNSIARLEDDLGVRFIDRGAAGSVLTPLGEIVAERAQRVLAEAADLQRDAALAAGGEQGLVRIGIGTALRRDLMPELVLRISDAHPNLGLHIEVNEGDRLFEALRNRVLDLIVCADGAPGDPDLSEPTPVLRSPVLAVVSPAHPLAARKDVGPDALAGQRFAGGVAVSLETGRRSYYRETLQDLEQPYTSNDFEALITLTRAGKIIQFLAEILARPYIKAGELTALPLELGIVATFAARTTRTAAFSPILQRVTGYATEIGKNLEAGR